MQYLHLKTKAQLLAGAYVCKHQVVWNSVLSENVMLYALARMDWDGSHFLLKMWVSQFPISIYLENLSTSTLKSRRIIVRRTSRHGQGHYQSRLHKGGGTAHHPWNRQGSQLLNQTMAHISIPEHHCFGGYTEWPLSIKYCSKFCDFNC